MKACFYKCCAVPMCKSTSFKTPQKLFINLPKIAKIRRKWLTLARRHPDSLSTTSTSHFCEDHFDLPNDMENYIQYTTMGTVSQIRMRTGCLPTKFACQSTNTDVCRPAAAKKLALALVNECKEEIRAALLQQNDNLNNELPSQSEDLQEQEVEKSIVDEPAQIYIADKHQSKTTQTESSMKQTSPIKFSRTFVSISPFKISDLNPFRSSVTCKSDDKSNSDILLYNFICST